MLKNKIFLAGAAVVIVLVLGSLFFGGQTQVTYQTAQAQKTDVIQEINVTGTVKPKESVDLAFEVSGKVSEIFADVGDEVKKGDKLISLNSADLYAQLSQAQASLDTAKARLKQFQAALSVEKTKLTELQKGTRPEEIQIAETAVANAQKDLDDANTNLSNVQQKADIDLSNLYDDVPNVLNDAYTSTDDALNKQIISLFSENTPNDFKLTFDITDASLKNEVEQKRQISENELVALKNEIDALTPSSNYDNALTNAKNHIIVARDMLSKLSQALDISTGLSASTLTTYKGYVNTARTNVNAEISSIDSQIQSISSQKIINQNAIFTAQSSVNDAQNALATAQDNLNLKKAGSTQEQLQAQENRVVQYEANVAEQEAQIKQAQASIANYQALIQKTTIYSPIDGTLTKQDLEVGEVVSPGVKVLAVIDRSKYNIEVYIPEADIAKAKLNDMARVTLDAYGNDVLFSAKIESIDPAETVIEGVSTYKSVLAFDDSNEKIKSGMTANVDITTGKSENVISIPQRAVIEKDGKKIVRILEKGNNVREVEVETGLKGSDGTIEIKSGISEGQNVVVFIQQ